MNIQTKLTEKVLVDIAMSSTLATMVVDSTGVIRISNEAAGQVFGRPNEDLCGTPLSLYCSLGGAETEAEAEALAWCTVKGGRRVLRHVSRLSCRILNEDLDLYVFRLAATVASPALGKELQDAILEIAKVPEIVNGDFANASNHLVQLVAEVLQVDRVSLWLLVDEDSAIECVSLFEMDSKQHSSGTRLSSNDYPRYFKAFESGRAIAADDALTDPRTSEFAVGYLDKLGITSMLDSMIRVSGKVIGVVCHEHVGLPRQWSQNEIIFAAEVADLAAHAFLVAKHREAEMARTRLEAELHQSQKLEAIGRLAGGVAHDFNNLLSVIMGHAEIASLEASPAVTESLNRIQGAAARAASLTNQLLSIGRRQVLQKQRIELNPLVDNVLKLLRSVIPERIVVEFEPCESEAAIDADAGKLEQAIMNLCLNAKDAMPAGGSILLRSRIDRDVGHDCSWVVLSVTDDGLGMTGEVAEKIFEPFYSTKTESGGTGLGLSMVYGIVRQHDGFVDVSTELGEGTTIELKFPCSPVPRVDGDEGVSASGEAAEA